MTASHGDHGNTGHVYHYKHGWVPIGGVAPPGNRSADKIAARVLGNTAQPHSMDVHQVAADYASKVTVTPEERDVLDGYTGAKHGSWFVGINGALRGEGGSGGWQAKADIMSKLAERYRTPDTIVAHRGLHGDFLPSGDLTGKTHHDGRLLLDGHRIWNRELREEGHPDEDHHPGGQPRDLHAGCGLRVRPRAGVRPAPQHPVPSGLPDDPPQRHPRYAASPQRHRTPARHELRAGYRDAVQEFDPADRRAEVHRRSAQGHVHMSAEKLPFTDADERIFNDPAPIAVTKGDWTTSDEAMAFLREHGVEAWQAWVAQQRAGGT